MITDIILHIIPGIILIVPGITHRIMIIIHTAMAIMAEDMDMVTAAEDSITITIQFLMTEVITPTAGSPIDQAQPDTGLLIPEMIIRQVPESRETICLPLTVIHPEPHQ